MGRWLKVCATNLDVSCSNSIFHTQQLSSFAGEEGGGGGFWKGIEFTSRERRRTGQNSVLSLCSPSLYHF